jgi:diguanylate cyclase (GGDEF)-like protein
VARERSPSIPAAKVGLARPILLILVFSAFLTIVAVTALGQAAVVSSGFSTTSLRAIVGADAATVRGFANAYLSPADLVPSPSADRSASIQADMAGLRQRADYLRIELRLPDGTLLAADEGPAGGRGSISTDFQAALDGRVTAAITAADGSEALDALPNADDVLREYLPLRVDDSVVAVIGIWRDAAPILGQLDEVRREVIFVTLSAAVLAAILLFLVFRSAQGRISRGTALLLEAGRRDPLTGTLNHGSLVEALMAAIDEAAADGRTVGIALLDIDNFRLLNETHGHGAGDEAIREVVDLLRVEMPPDTMFGRYGPDEFLAISSTDLTTLDIAMESVRIGLVDRALTFDGSESLPISVSIGRATFPDHALSVTDLLSSAVGALQEAKASGGDAIRLAGAVPDVPAASQTFNLFEGLILAVDAKDRYTKRHCEDVSRYAVYLAHRLGLDEEAVGSIRVAGLLHDVGKIGIPDGILRKPANLTASEMAVVQQHVALGDMIVRDLPNIDVIRAGVRFHHERWDGAGYLDRLEGDRIPLVARILAVGDAFSAMTTTRPYRKALPVREALSRLEDVAGSQLDEHLVVLFAEGVRSQDAGTATDLELPGGDLWRPYWRVA